VIYQERDSTTVWLPKCRWNQLKAGEKQRNVHIEDIFRTTSSFMPVFKTKGG
jgi:hypothetical protein